MSNKYIGNRNEKIEKWKPKTRFGLYQIWKHIVETRNLLKLKNRNLKRQVRLSTTKHVDVSSSPPGLHALPPQSGCLGSSPGNFLRCTPCSFPAGQSCSVSVWVFEQLWSHRCLRLFRYLPSFFCQSIPGPLSPPEDLRLSSLFPPSQGPVESISLSSSQKLL